MVSPEEIRYIYAHNIDPKVIDTVIKEVGYPKVWIRSGKAEYLEW